LPPDSLPAFGPPAGSDAARLAWNAYVRDWRKRRRQQANPGGGVGYKAPEPCQACGAPDSRDAAHARGCPALPEVSQARRMAIALACEEGWRRKAEAKARAAYA
jgi:hypothetical protein